MKTTSNNFNKKSKQGISNKPRPEVRDDLDHHKNKGTNTPNKNETISKKDRKKGKEETTD